MSDQKMKLVDVSDVNSLCHWERVRVRVVPPDPSRATILD
jgi:hypothetical protein